MTIYIDCEQGTERWLQARAGVCTASRFSDARSRMKQNRNGKKVGDTTDAALSYAQLLAIERIAGEPLDSTFETLAMRRGRELEPVARRRYEEETGNMVESAGIVLTDDYRFGYSTDGRVHGENGRVEIKCPMAADKVAGVWLDPEPVIAEYLDQCHGGMWIEQLDWIDLVVYTPWLACVGKDLFIHRIHRDQDYIDALEADLLEFIRMVNDLESRLRGGASLPLFVESDSTRPTVAPEALPAELF